MDALTAVFGLVEAGDEESQPQPPAATDLGIGGLPHLADSPPG